MPLHPDFQQIKRNFIKKYGKKLGTQYFYRWLNKHNYDDTKPYPNKKKSAMEEFEQDYRTRMTTTLQLDALEMDNEPHPFVFQDHWVGSKAHTHHLWETTDNVIKGMCLRPHFTTVPAPPVVLMEQAKSVLQLAIILNNKPFDTKLKAIPLIPSSLLKHFEGVNNSGVFLIRDKGVQYYGAQLPHFKEFFLSGNSYTGRWVYTQAENEWSITKPADQTPYVLSRKAVLDGWVPPYLISCLPPDIRASLGTKYKYWEQYNRAQRLAVRNDIVKNGHM